MKITTEITKDNYDELKIDLVASNDVLENDWWRITVDNVDYDIEGNKLKEFCKAILSVLN